MEPVPVVIAPAPDSSGASLLSPSTSLRSSTQVLLVLQFNELHVLPELMFFFAHRLVCRMCVVSLLRKVETACAERIFGSQDTFRLPHAPGSLRQTLSTSFPPGASLCPQSRRADSSTQVLLVLQVNELRVLPTPRLCCTHTLVFRCACYPFP